MFAVAHSIRMDAVAVRPYAASHAVICQEFWFLVPPLPCLSLDFAVNGLGSPAGPVIQAALGWPTGLARRPAQLGDMFGQ